jgi:hypothetical protein
VTLFLPRKAVLGPNYRASSGKALDRAPSARVANLAPTFPHPSGVLLDATELLQRGILFAY